jgi:hypothetical protein
MTVSTKPGIDFVYVTTATGDVIPGRIPYYLRRSPARTETSPGLPLLIHRARKLSP